MAAPAVYETDDKRSNEVIECRNIFKVAYEFCIPHWIRAQRHADMYENKIDRNNWPTLSEIALPLFYNTIEQGMPFMMEYLFPEEAFIELVPLEEAVDYGSVRKAERFLEHRVRHTVRLKKRAVTTLRDALKYGAGYGAVVPKIIYPATRVDRTAMAGGVPVGRVNSVEALSATTVTSYRPVGFGEVLPIGDGSDIDSNSVVLWVDFIPEAELRGMYKADMMKQPEDRVFVRNPDEIIEEARRYQLDNSLYPSSAIIAKLAGKIQHEQVRQNRNQKGVPATIAVIKVMHHDRHVWIANGTTVIHERRSGSQEVPLKRELVMAKPWPDSDKFFNSGLAGIAEDISYGVNVFYNAIMDLLQYYLAPARVVNTRMLTSGQEIPRHEPYVTYRANGDASKVVHYPDPPPFPAGLLNFGDVLQEFYAQTTGQPRAMQGQGSPGLMRGGLAAFETLLQSPMGREKFAGQVLEMSWLEDTLDRIMIMEQILIPQDGTTMVEKQQSASGTVFEEARVTQDDLRHAYQLRTNLRAKMRNAISEHSLRAMRYDRGFNNPRVNQDALWEDFVGSRVLADRLRATPQEYEENLRAMQMREQQASMPPGEQAMEGQGSAQGGVNA